MLIGYVNTMTDFAKKTRNVHKELKDTLTNTGMVLHQYMKRKSSTPKGKDIKSTCTQTDEAPTNYTQPKKNQREKTVNVSADTPGWLPTLMEREPSSRKNELNRRQPQQCSEEHADSEEFILVERKKKATRQIAQPLKKIQRQSDQDALIQRESRL